MNIGNNINYLRFKKSVTQNELAEYLGVTYQAVSKWENEANLPDISLIPQIANFFGVSIDTLFSENISDEEIFEDIADDDVIRVVQMHGKKRIKVDRTFHRIVHPSKSHSLETATTKLNISKWKYSVT